MHEEISEKPPHMMSLLFLFVPLLVVLLHRLLITTRSASSATFGGGSSNGRLPPSPPRLPIIGNLHLVGFLPHVSLRNLAARYGRDFMLVHFGAVPTLVVSSPRAAEAVLRTHDHIFSSRPPLLATSSLFYGCVDIVFSDYGQHWRHAKKVLITHMLTVKKVQSYRAAREGEVRLAMARIAGAAAARQALDMSELLHSFTTDLMCRAVSRKFFKIDGRSRLFHDLIADTGSLIGGFNLEDYFPRLLDVGFIKRACRAKADRLRKRWDEVLDKTIDDYEYDGDGKTVHPREEEEDFTGALLSRRHEYGLTREIIKAILIDIIFGGTDTSYLVLEFTVAELLRNRRVMSKLREELRNSIPKGQDILTEDDLGNMTYLKAVIKETLRLHPPAPLFAHHLSTEDDVHIDGYLIPGKAPVLVNAWALGRDASVWEDAEEFKPERFVDAGICFRGNDFRLLPFSTGRRMCPGLNFSIPTVEIMLGNLICKFDWELPAGMQDEDIDMREVFYLTVHRKEKLLVIPKKYVK